MRYSYGAFGQTTTWYTSYVGNPYRYNAEYVDSVPGVPDMQYLRARYYALMRVDFSHKTYCLAI